MGTGPLALDRVAVFRGALGVLMFVAPGYAIARAGWWVVLVAALLFGSTFGGYAAARDRPATPVTHAAVAAALGLTAVFTVALIVQALQGDLTLAAAITSVVIVQVGTGLGCLGGLLAEKGYRP